MDCIFCKIANGQISCHKVYEDRDFLGFLDISPLNKGHSLVIPKKHYRWVIDVPNFQAYWKVAGKVACAIRKALSTDSINFVTLGYEVPHAHIHVIPRFLGDDLGGTIDWTKKKEFNDRQMTEIAEKIISDIHDEGRCFKNAHSSEGQAGRQCRSSN